MSVQGSAVLIIREFHLMVPFFDQFNDLKKPC